MLRFSFFILVSCLVISIQAYNNVDTKASTNENGIKSMLLGLLPPFETSQSIPQDQDTLIFGQSSTRDQQIDQILNHISVQQNKDESIKIVTKDPQRFSTIEDLLSSPEFRELTKSIPDSFDKNRSKLEFNAVPKDLQTKERCFIISFHDDTPDHIMENIKYVLQSPLLQGNLTGLFEKVMKGLTVCFQSSQKADQDDDSFPYLDLFKQIPWIKIIERDYRIFGCQVQNNAPWGLSRISKANLPIDWTYPFDHTAEGVCVYVLDSGVQADHPEFGGRVDPVYSAFGPPSRGGIDYSGHGTEVASVLAGTNLGIAKKATIKSIQILGDDGSGKNSDLMRGLEWLARHMQQPAVVNLSLAGPKSMVLDASVNRLLKTGVPVIVAAGNHKSDACYLSPCSIHGCITVGSTNEYDERSSFSNYGTCVDIFAPGSNIMVATSGQKSTTGRSSVNGYSISGGTSLSAPYVSGVAALLLQKDPSLKNDEIWREIQNLAISDALNSNTLSGSPNLLLQTPPVTNRDLKLVVLSSTIPNPRIFDPDRNETWTPIGGSTSGDEWTMSSTTWIILGATLGGTLLIAIGLFFWIGSILSKRTRREQNIQEQLPKLSRSDDSTLANYRMI